MSTSTATLTLDVQEIADVFRLSPTTIRSVLSRNPSALPPRLIIQGQKKLLWLRTDVEAWLGKQTRKQGTNPELKTADEGENSAVSVRKRGRPTKAEQMARQRAALNAAAERAEGSGRPRNTDQSGI